MPLSENINNLEKDKFVDVDGETTVKVTSIGGLSVPSDSDSIVASYPNATTEVYEYKSGGVSGTLLQTITVTYTDSTKEFIDTVVKT